MDTVVSSADARQQFRDQAKVVGEEIKEFGAQGKAAAREVVGDAVETASEYYAAGREHIGEYRDHVAKYVRKNPLKSLLFAAGAGAAIAVIARR